MEAKHQEPPSTSELNKDHSQDSQSKPQLESDRRQSDARAANLPKSHSIVEKGDENENKNVDKNANPAQSHPNTMQSLNNDHAETGNNPAEDGQNNNNMS